MISIQLFQNRNNKLCRKLACAAVSLGCVGDRTGSAVAIGFASFAIVVAVGVALTMLAIAEGLFAQPLLDDFSTLLRAFGPPLILDITDCRLSDFGFNLPVSIKSRASEI